MHSPSNTLLSVFDFNYHFSFASAINEVRLGYSKIILKVYYIDVFESLIPYPFLNYYKETNITKINKSQKKNY